MGYKRGQHPNSNNLSKAGKGRGQAVLNVEQTQELISKIIEWTCEGLLPEVIRPLIFRASSVQINDNLVTKLIQTAHVRLQEITRPEVEMTIALHVAKYEQVYEYFDSIDEAAGCNKAMKAKEKLLGILKKNITVNHNKKTVILRDVKYDMSRLSEEEQKRLKEIIEMAK